MKIEQLAPYPEGLLIWDGTGNYKYRGFSYQNKKIFLSRNNEFPKVKSLSKCKPYLYSLDCLTKEIEHNGEKFVPYQEASMSQYDIDNVQGKMWDIGIVPFHIVQKLFEWHFNVFNLPENEWININDIIE